ncbi:MAG: hypothetical protein ACO3A2_09780 [Bdellovibrionia bacterium]
MGFLLLSQAGILGCSSPSYDTSTTVANSLKISNSIAIVNQSLSSGNCAAALAEISPLYTSVSTNNDIRFATANTYACSAGVNIMQIFSDLISFGDLSGSMFWKFLVQEFPSVASPDDKKPLSAELGMDALFAMTRSGIIIGTSDQVNASGRNPGSILVTDRTNQANSYLTFLSMALMGSLLDRYGAPDASHVKTSNLPWTTPAATVGDGCSFVSGLLNFYDSLPYILGASSSTSVQSAYQSIDSFLSLGLDTACSAGCTLCGLSCTSCPRTLRNRDSCTGQNSDANSCAAAGVTAFVNAGWT